MKEIPLTQRKVALVDDEDYAEISKYNWHAENHYHTFYAKRRLNAWENISMHNQILGVKGVDHKNRNGLDNRRENLRRATKSQNNMNSRARNGKRFKGTTESKSKKIHPWVAQAHINGKKTYLGCYKTEEEAARAYDTTVKVFYGEYARLNFPEEE